MVSIYPTWAISKEFKFRRVQIPRFTDAWTSVFIIQKMIQLQQIVNIWRKRLMILLLKNEWEILNQFREGDYTVDNSLVGRILASRHILSDEERVNFLAPPLEVGHNPFLFEDMHKACDIILKALDEHSKIVIYGDYDVDGITSTSVLLMFLSEIGADVTFIIPDRITEGYGLGKSGTEKIIGQKCNLVITVDCGISSVDEVQTLMNSGIQVIITDHHECKSVIPLADAVINPKRPDSKYPFKGLAGAGVAIKLIQGICMRLDLCDKWTQYLDLAAMGTVGDIVPLIDENRMIVYHGLKILNSLQSMGLRSLLDKLELKSNIITSVTIGYSIAPYINAAGRMGDGNRAVLMLTGNDFAICNAIADELIKDNARRREIELEIFENAKSQLIDNFDPMDYTVLIAYSKEWHQGVLGTEYFKRSVIVFGWDGQFYKGSGRSANSDSILEAIEYAKEHVMFFGGHKKAAGLTIEESSIDSFINSIKEYSSGKSTECLYGNKLQIDFIVPFEMLDIENAFELEQLEPFGESNPKPLLACMNLEILQVKDLTGGKHMKVVLGYTGNDLNSQTRTVDGIAFGLSNQNFNLLPGDRVNVAFHLQINDWQGKKTVQLQIRDFQRIPSEFDNRNIDYEKIYLNDADGLIKKIRNDSMLKEFYIPQSDDYSAAYKYFKTKFGQDSVICDLQILSDAIDADSGVKIPLFKLSRIFDIFEETKLLECRNIGDLRKAFRLVEANGRVNLSESRTYRKLSTDTF
jgi:single-stranded-DNA-specific exonuclease